MFVSRDFADPIDEPFLYGFGEETSLKSFQVYVGSVSECVVVGCDSAPMGLGLPVWFKKDTDPLLGLCLFSQESRHF